MKLKIVFALAILLVLNMAAFAQNVDSLAGKKVVVLGDSITQDGRYVSFINYFLEKLFPQKDFFIYGLGLSSETVSGLTEEKHPFPRPCLFERLGRLFERIKPEVVLACYGMNDGVYKPLDPERFAAFKNGVNKMIEQCKTAGVKEIYLVTPPIFDQPLKGTGFNYETVLAEYSAWEKTVNVPGVKTIDLHTPMLKAREGRKEPFSKDRVHPGDDGHLLMAKTILATFGVQVADVTTETFKAEPLYKLVDQKRALLASRWMNHIGFTRGRTIKPESLGTTEAEVAKLQEKIDAERRKK